MHTSRHSPTTAEAYEPLINAHGRDIVEAVITGGALASPRSMIPNFAEILVAVIVRTPTNAKSWIETLMNVVSTDKEVVELSTPDVSSARIPRRKGESRSKEEISGSRAEVRPLMLGYRTRLTGFYR